MLAALTRSARPLATATRTHAAPLSLRETRRTISVQSILHGSPEAQREGDVAIQQHSRLVARGKYVHGFEDDPALHVKLSGSWEVVVGEQDTFCESRSCFFFRPGPSRLAASTGFGAALSPRRRTGWDWLGPDGMGWMERDRLTGLAGMG
ncbi:hypothetical protein EIP86_002236 [Pleurotus ostreatoroseus]|nr:hypothetical protein EIP86_002236 [Pleurotus ostreatoroseus]